MKMLDLEGQWTDLLATNNITSIVGELNNITKNVTNKADVDETLASVSCWLQRTAEFTKKELLSLCFSRCQGLWMFLNRYSSLRIHNLLQKLSNLITLVQWARRKLHPGQSWPDCKHTLNTRRSFWKREERELKKHLWLGRLVEWWSLMGLLPKHQESKGEKQIAHMWKEIKQCRQKSGLTNSEEQRCNLVMQGLVTHLVQQHGSLWTPETSGQQCYPPSSLKALLKLVMVPRVDTQSVQAVIMYFILDVAKFLQCRNDLFNSFCRAFNIPASFSHQIRAFWMFDHGQIKTAMNLLLSPRTALPRFSWQHRCILKSLLSRKEHLWALRYLHLTGPATESVEDVKLRLQVLLQNSCVSEAWALIKRYHSEDMVTHFLQACSALGLSAAASKYIPPGYEVQSENDAGESLQLKVGPPCPLSASLYQAQRTGALSIEELLRLLTQAVAELRLPPNCAPRQLTWPHHTQRETKAESSEVFQSTEVSFRSPSPSFMDTAARIDDYNPEKSDHPSSCPSPVPPVHSRRRVSFSSVSSLSPIRKDQTFSYESTVTLQQISALLIHDQEEEEEVSQVSVTAEVFTECHDRTLEGSAVPFVDHACAPHSSQNRFYSTDCCTDLPSLPEEIVQTPTTLPKPAEPEDSEIFPEDASTIPNSLPQNKPQKEVDESRAEELSSETAFNTVNAEDQTNQTDRSEGGSQADAENDDKSIPPVGPSHLPPHSHFLCMSFTHYKEDTKTQTDKVFTAGRQSAGKVSVRSRRARKSKRVK